MYDDYFGPGYDDVEDGLESLADGMEELEHQEVQRAMLDLPTPIASSEPPQPATKTPSQRARFLEGLVLQLTQDEKLLLADTGQAFAYQEDQGYFQPVPQLSSYIANFLHQDTTASLLSRDLREMMERLSWHQEIQCASDQFNGHPEMVNLENGVLNAETNELLPHDPRFRFTYVIHAEYLADHTDLECPAFEDFCKTSLEGDPAKRQLLLEFIGYTCLDTNAGKCAMFFKGQPNSGKSVVSEFITRLFDKELVSNIPLHQLGDRFFRAELAGKKLNVAGEIAGRALRDISIFKSVTGNDRITGEYKGKDPFYFTPRCKLLFSGNTLPLTTEADATAAFINRIRVLLFNHSVPPKDQDKMLLDKLWWERNCIVTLALQAAQCLAERNFEFTQPEDSKKFLGSFALRGNTLGAFLEECCVLSPDARIFNVELYAAFEAFCARNGLERLSRAKFYELLSGVPHVTAKRLRIGTENRQGHEGIALK